MLHRKQLQSPDLHSLGLTDNNQATQNLSFVEMFTPNISFIISALYSAASHSRSERRCISDLCFSWLAAALLACCGTRCYSLYGGEELCVCVCPALQKQFSLCTLDNVIYVCSTCQICTFGATLSRLLPPVALCSLNSVWIMHSNFTSLCLWGPLIEAVTPHESLLLTVAPWTRYKLLLTVEPLL